MKLLFSTLLIGVANAALPPGYEDQMYCPPGNCQLYIHKKGMGGPQSAFNKCYNPSGVISEGIWTGSKVDTVPPNDYIQPEKCFESERESSSSISPTPSPSMTSTTGSTSMATLEKIPSMCDSDDQCQPLVRGSAPQPFTGVDLCGCFAESDIDPFDQCEGDSRESCATARCMGEDVDNCYAMEAYCDLPPDDNGMGECRLREAEDTDDADDTDNDKKISSSDDDGDEDTIPAQCDSDDQCSPMIRSQQPAGQFTGVPACECFASSYVSPFDQCEGSERCRQVRCVPGGCDGLEAYCDIAPNDNGIGQCQLRSTNSEESETYAVE